MPTLNLVSLGTMLKIEYTDQQDRYINKSTTVIDIITNNDGTSNVVVQIGNGRYPINAITDIQVAGVPITNQLDFEAKLAILFPKANTGSGGSGVSESRVNELIDAFIRNGYQMRTVGNQVRLIKLVDDTDNTNGVTLDIQTV